LRQCDRYLIEPHRIFKRELIERLFPQAASIAGCPADVELGQGLSRLRKSLAQPTPEETEGPYFKAPLSRTAFLARTRYRRAPPGSFWSGDDQGEVRNRSDWLFRRDLLVAVIDGGETKRARFDFVKAAATD